MTDYNRTLHIAYIGVVSNSTEKSLIDVIPIEAFPSYLNTVDIVKEKIEVMVKVGDATGPVPITLSNSIEAEWLNTNSNRVTPPHVKLGTRVFIWRNSDTETYYWESIEEYTLREQEHLQYLYSNPDTSVELTPEILNEKVTEANAYSIIVSTREKLIQVKTNKNDNEAHAYDIKLDIANSKFSISDDLGNNVLLDSANSIISMANIDNSSIVIDKTNITISCDGTLTTNATDISNNAASTVVTTAASTTVDAPTNTITGTLQVDGVITSPTITDHDTRITKNTNDIATRC
jgi:hypothetical protein